MIIKNPLTFGDMDVTMQPTQDNLFDALVLEGIVNKREKWSTYKFGDMNVPRVSEILKECIGKDYLMKWALRLGKEAYDRESIDTLMTGTLVHEMIEHFLLYGVKKEVQFRSYKMKMKTEKAYLNFLSWYRDMINKGYVIEPVAIEKEIVCPWFGGTIDCIMRIYHKEFGIDKIFIVDFKTSKQLSIDYLLQTFAYLWAIKWNKEYIDPTLPSIDGIGIIRIDKENNRYEDLFLDYEIPEQSSILTDIDYALGAMINWYYHIINLNYDLRVAKKF